MARLIIVTVTLSFLGITSHYVGSYSYWRDILCLLISLGLMVFIRAAWKTLARRVFRKPAFKRITTIDSGVGRDLISAVFSVLICWAVLSIADFVFESRPLTTSVNPSASLQNDDRQGIGLALSGGGYRAALFHAGVLAELEMIGVRPTALSTVSGGSIIGAFYAAGGRPEDFLNGVINGRFNLERRVLRLDNAIRLLVSELRTIRVPFTSWHPLHPSDDPFTTTMVLAQMLDDLFLHGALVKDGPRNQHIEQMICVTDIANSEILGITRRGALIRSIDSSLRRTHFDNPTWKPADLATFQSNEIIGLPGQWPISVLVAASGGFPAALPPIRVKRWTAIDGFMGTGLLADGGLGDNSGISQFDTIQYLSFSAIAKENQPGQVWGVPLILVSDGSALAGRFTSNQYFSEIGRSIDVIYSAVGGPLLIAHREPTSNSAHTGLVDIPHPKLVLLSPRTISRQEGRLVPDQEPSALLGFEMQTGFPELVHGIPLEMRVVSTTPLTLATISEEGLRSLVSAMPTAQAQRAMPLINSLIAKGRLTTFGLVPYSMSPLVLTTDQKALCDIIIAEIDHSLREFMNASTLKDHFDRNEAESIYRLGRYVVSLNQQFINCEIGVSPCMSEH